MSSLTRRALLLGAAAAAGTTVVWRRSARATVDAARALPVVDHRTVQGMTVSCPTWGWEWGTDAMVATMAELKSLGVNWIAIHPYARVADDGTVSARELASTTAPKFIERPIREAHALGLKIMIKPHLAYWSSRFSWRGAIEFADPSRFWSTYLPWIEQLAAWSASADAFVVGTELDRMTGDEAHWREVIARVRTRTRAHLTFASNWDAYTRIGFWDALDAIGVQAYFPLVDGETAPDDAGLRAGWERAMAPLRALHRDLGKPILFTELGYTESPQAAAEPWGYHPTGPGAVELQSRCLRVALDAVRREPAVVGAFLWKWFPGDLETGDFRMASAHTRAVIRDAWRPGAAAP